MKSDDLVTPADVEREMVELTGRIERAPMTLREYHERMRAARATHRTAYALAYSAAEGTQMERRMRADLDTIDTAEAVDRAEIEYKYATDTFDGLRTKLRALQSVSSLMKASMFGSQGGI
jgi:hypothetical protein